MGLKVNINAEIEHFFRHEYGKVVSALTSKYSAGLIDFIEDSVQEALLKATQLWAYKSIPDNPSGWLFRVANNHLIDQLRRNKKTITIEGYEKTILDKQNINDESLTSGIDDELLKMIFACAHPKLSQSEQIMLCLKLICGFSVKEISNALIKKEEAVKKAITRAKTKFKTEIGRPQVPPRNELMSRLNVVLKVIYLMFNEGYKATEGKQLIKGDISKEAIRLAKIINEHESCNTPELNALLSLMYFNSARFEARINESGELVTLEKQNRKLWNKELIELGIHYLTAASYGVYISKYHLEAGIASEYSTASKYEDTNWELILTLYEMLLKVDRNPFVELNRIVVFEKVSGAEKALLELKQIENNPVIQKSYLYYSIKADLKISLGDDKNASELLEKAISLTSNSIENKFLVTKLNSIK
jgi:RNA polymerase sigma factor (sigma-70 family)